MNRRHFIQKTAILTLAATWLANNSRADGPTATPDVRFTALRRGVGIFTLRGGTIGYLATKDALAVIDSQFPDCAQILIDGLKQQTTHPFDLLVNTHHHADHTGGNGVLGPLARESVAHKNVPALQKNATKPEDLATQFFAKTTYESSYKADLGDESIELHYYGPAHTSGDSVVHFVNANVVHMGDLVFNRRSPYIDRSAGASIKNWITLLETTHKTFTDDTRFIYGHAGKGFEVHGPRADLLVMRDYLTSLLLVATESLKAGKSEDEVAAISLLKGFESYGPGEGKLSVGANLRVAYQEVKAL